MITLNTSIPYGNNKYNKNTTSFNGNLPVKSAFLNPFKKTFNKLTDGIGKYYYGPLISSRPANWLFHRNDISKIVDHMQAIGSYIISGMYMIQTLRNKDMDEDRRTTLAINQGLTLVASTAIAYFISNRLEKPWDENVTMKYAANKLDLSKDELDKRLKKHQDDIKQKYFTKHQDDIKLENIDINSMKKLYKNKNKSLDKFDSYISDLIKDKSIELELKKFKKPDLAHYLKEGIGNEDLAGKVRGLNVLKSLIVFGSVYRFFGPVAVTPVATWLGNKLTGASKKVTAENGQKAQQSIQQGKENIYNGFSEALGLNAKAKFLRDI